VLSLKPGVDFLEEARAKRKRRRKKPRVGGISSAEKAQCVKEARGIRSRQKGEKDLEKCPT